MAAHIGHLRILPAGEGKGRSRIRPPFAATDRPLAAALPLPGLWGETGAVGNGRAALPSLKPREFGLEGHA